MTASVVALLLIVAWVALPQRPGRYTVAPGGPEPSAATSATTPPPTTSTRRRPVPPSSSTPPADAAVPLPGGNYTPEPYSPPPTGDVDEAAAERCHTAYVAAYDAEKNRIRVTFTEPREAEYRAAKDDLDQRRARGEVTREEYVRRLNALRAELRAHYDEARRRLNAAVIPHYDQEQACLYAAGER